MTTPAPGDVPQELIDELKLLAASAKADLDLAETLIETRDADGSYNVNRAAAQEWRYSAADAARLVDVTESGSSRKMSDLSKNALAMVAHFTGLAGDTVVVTPTARPARTRAIVRE